MKGRINHQKSNVGLVSSTLFSHFKFLKNPLKSDQTLIPPPRALELIGAELQKQYERWQPRARYKHNLDPTLDEVKKLCVSLRKNAKVTI